MDDETSTTRRNVLQGLAASGALAFGGVGLAAADHGGNGGNRGGGDKDHGQGGGGGGGGGTNPTGGSALLVFPYDEESPNLPAVGDTFTINSESDDTVEWYSGCDAVGSNARPKTYRGVSVTWTVGSGPSTIYVVENRPVVPAEGYHIAETPEECGTNTPDDSISDDRYDLGSYYKTGWEPSGEEHE
ncbi:hypothetical protein ACKVMT_17480 [Halobacteriales archaeon Cl-PHB]